MTNEEHFRAKFLLQSKKYNDGLAYVKGLLAASPQDDLLHAFLALLYQGLMNMSEAEKSIIQAIRLNPTEFLHYKNASKILLLSENPEKADEFISSALKLNPEDSDLFAFKGIVYISRREYNKAVLVTNKGLKLDPNNSQNLRTKALALSFLNEQKDADEISRDLLKNDPINAQNLLVKGVVSLNDSKKTSSDELRATLAFQPNNPHIQNAFRLSLRSELSGFLCLQNWSIGMGKSDSGPSVFVRILYVLFALVFIIISLFEGIKNVWLDLYLGFWNMNLVIQLSVFIYLPLYDTWLFFFNKESRALFDKTLKLKILIANGFIVLIISLSILGIVYNSIISNCSAYLNFINISSSNYAFKTAI